MKNIKRSSVNVSPLEHVEQAHLFQWAVWQSGKYPELDLMYAIPNGGYRHHKTAAELKAEGVKAGVCDIFLPVARCNKHGLYIEMKRTKGSKLSNSQKEFIAGVKEQGYAAAVCYGFEQAKDGIMSYLNDEYKE